MATFTFNTGLNGAGDSIAEAIVRTAGNGYVIGDHTLAVATPGTLTTRTDDSSGVITAAGHTFQAADGVDVYWAGGRRYGMSVGTPAGDTFPISGGAGDVLPPQTTVVNTSLFRKITSPIIGDLLEILGIQTIFPAPTSDSKAHLEMQDNTPATIASIDTQGNTPLIYDIAGGATNIFAGNPITDTIASNGDPVQTCVLRILGLQRTA